MTTIVSANSLANSLTSSLRMMNPTEETTEEKRIDEIIPEILSEILQKTEEERNLQEDPTSETRHSKMNVEYIRIMSGLITE